jgi:preprotein translocase subunit YajC
VGAANYGAARRAANISARFFRPATHAGSAGLLPMFSFIPQAYAQEASGGLTGSGVLQFLPIVLIFGVFYFMMIRPQQQAQKTLKAQLSAVKRGDRVLTAGGIVGVVQKARDGVSEIEVEIAPSVRVTVVRETLTQVLTGSVPAPANDPK